MRWAVTGSIADFADYRQLLGRHLVDTRYVHSDTRHTARFLRATDADARRVGILAGLVSGLRMRRSAEIGCTLASFVLESVGTQEHTFDADDFASRVAWTYGADSATDVRAFPAASRRTDQEETA